jgi:hypothetical protein
MNLMSGHTRTLIQRHWSLANQRAWPAFAALLADDLKYEVPQTRERIDSGAGYLDLFSTWPGDWRADVRELVCDGPKAVCRIDFCVDGQVMTGISFFTLNAGGRIAEVVDYWPEPYEPPPRSSRHMRRY